MDISEIQPQETFEARNEGTEQQQLNDATLEPHAFLEQVGNFEQSEAIQGNYTILIENAVREANLALQVTTGSSGGVSGTGGEQVGITPINLPREADLASGSGGVAGSGGEQVGITPINLPREADLASGSGGVAGSGVEQVGITPINLPREANLASGGVTESGGDGVASGAVRGPGGDGVAISTVKGPGGDQVGEMPVPFPPPEDEIGLEAYLKEPAGSGEIPLPGITGEIRQVELENAAVDHMVTGFMDGLPDLTSYKQLELQQLMEKKTQIEATLSNILKSFNNTQSDLVANLK